MKVLAFDPGGIRQGFAVVGRSEDDDKSKPPTYYGSGYFGCVRHSNGSKDEPYQEWRLRILALWVDEASRLLREYKPDLVVSEIVPVVGGGNFVAATQSQLAATAITATQAIAVDRGVQIKQVGATTVKARIGRSKKATKPKVRDGVLELLPQLEHRRPEWTGDKAIWDEPDAIAVGLTHLGYKNG